ncbi:MAG: hypothetical protein HY909_20805 [Deltaproteobacteria bacterium]|nr:hypothetical protein [Deltaproteobacteria bacterium]
MLTTEASCPFCERGLAQLSPAPDTRRRLSRAAAFAFGATLAAGACSSSTTGVDAGGGDTARAESGPPEDTTPRDTGARDTNAQESGPPDDTGGPMPEYGAPPPQDAGRDAAGPTDTGAPVAAYGAPAPRDAGRDAAPPDDEGGGSADYGAPPKPDAGGAMNLYGAPPRDGGS